MFVENCLYLEGEYLFSMICQKNVLNFWCSSYL